MAKTMHGQLTIAIAGAALALALGCSRPLTSDDAGMSGGGGARIMTGGDGGAGGSAGASGGGGTGAAVDAGSDQSSCANLCGMVRGVPINGSCMYTLACPLPGAFTGMIVFVDGQMVLEDPTRTEGWEFTDGSRSVFQFFGQACADVTSSGAFLDVDMLCELAAP
ncbi:MAG TPA: hypothetical protein VKQ32_19825 [Polyangia bacterium]|nr:hypothetical protein [Polyangia bacterium]